MDLHPAIIALLAGLPSFALGYLAYRQSKKVDKVSEQSGVTSGMSQLIADLQADNKELRGVVLGLKEDIKGFVIEVSGLREEIRVLNTLLVKSGKQE